jgi:peptidoglycan/LPS O-acetylase OafA/YrhL
MNEDKSDFHRQHFESIQALRGVTALFILLEHIRFLNCGAFGVDIFFVISGFMIMFSTHHHTKYFLRKRLIRILPLYYLMTLGTFLLLILFPGMFEQTKADPVFLIKSLLFIPFDIGGGILQPLMRIGWTINCEIFFYILFFISMRISHKYRGLICALFLILLTCVAYLLPSCPVPLAFYGSPVMLEFLFGIICYYAARKLYEFYGNHKLPSCLFPFGCLILAVLFLMLLCTKPFVNILGFGRPVYWGLPAFMIVLCTFLAGLYEKKIPYSLAALGDISFSLYLIHYYPVMLLDRAVFDFSAPTPLAFFGTAIAIAVSVVLALISHQVIEKSLTLWLHRIWIPSAPAA